MIEGLPFKLTAAQEKAVVDIDADLGKPERMLRLLQGDVGSGKTVVAALAMLHAIEAGTQAALMAPTEVLARQHASSIADLLAPTGVVMALLTGRERGPARRRLLERLRSGEVQALIGTHALFQDDVEFADLGLAVIDEQHRFGVDQRIELAKKGPASDVLVMTATPIPRTLVLSFYGDIAMSELREKPAGRKPIRTRALPQSKLGQVVDAIGRALEQGEQVFWVCPLVNASEELDMVAAEDRFQSLKQVFGDKVGLVHGQMKPAEKRRGHGRLRQRQNPPFGRHHRDRGRGRHTRRHRDGDRACRALRPCPAAPAARADRTWRSSFQLSFDLRRAAG